MESLSYRLENEICVLSFKNQQFSDSPTNYLELLMSNSSVKAVVVDLTEVTTLGYEGLRDLLMILSTIRRLSIPMALALISENYVNVLDLVRLSEFFMIYPTREAALKSMVYLK